MIKSTFYNLPEPKRQRIIEAIIVEFSNANHEKVSINRIIQRANISRGSFYQYFDDKVDLVEVLITSIVDRVREQLEKIMQHSGDDIFYTYEKLFDVIADFDEEGANHSLLKRLARNLKTNDGLVSDYLTNRFNGISDYKDSFKSYSRAKLRYQSDEDFELLMQMLTGMLKNALFNLYVVGMDRETVRRNYLRKLEILSTGAVLK